MLRLEAVWTVKVAAKTGYDGEREVGRIVPAGLVPFSEDLDLVSVVRDEHPPLSELDEKAGRAVGGLIAGEEEPERSSMALGDAEEGSADPIEDVGRVSALDPNVVPRLSHARSLPV